MADRENPHDLLPLVELIDDSVCPDTKRPQSAESTAKRMTCFRFSLKQSERLAHSIRKRPFELENLSTSPPDELDPAHLSSSATLEIPTNLGKRHRLPSLSFLAPFLDRGKGFWIRKDLGRLLQRLVLVDRNQHGRRTPPPGNDDVLPHICHAVDDLTELVAKLSNRNRLAHGSKCTLSRTQLSARRYPGLRRGDRLGGRHS